MNNEQELALSVKPDNTGATCYKPNSIVAVQVDQPTVADMLYGVIKGGVSAENVNAVKELVGLYERMEDKKAEKSFAEAFVALQSELPVISGYRGIPDKTGKIKFAYANFEDIDGIVRPICLKHGFTYSFREDSVENGRTKVIMRLQHSSGSFRDIPYSVRIGSGPPGSSEAQGDVSAHTYAQRGALESGLALRIIGMREDAKMEGGPITEAQAFELERRVKETNSDVAAFLRYAGASKFSEIPSAKYDVLDQFLSLKEKRR